MGKQKRGSLSSSVTALLISASVLMRFLLFSNFYSLCQALSETLIRDLVLKCYKLSASGGNSHWLTYVIHFKFVGIKDMHNIYYLGLSGERSLPFVLLV